MSDQDTQEFRICVFHHKHSSQIERIEAEMKTLWQHYNGMQKWVIAGCTSAVLGMAAVVVNLIVVLSTK